VNGPPGRDNAGWGLLPVKLADWLIRCLGLRHE